MNISIISKEVARWAELFLFLAVATASSLSSVLADEAEVAYLQPTRRQSSNSYASSHRALMRDRDEQPSEEPDVASIINGTATGGPLSYQVGLATGPGDGKHRDPPFNKVLINAYNLSVYDEGIPNGGGIVQASSSTVHPDYNATGNLENDIALLWFLPYPIAEDESFKFATLNEDHNVPVKGKELFVSGWGKTTLFLGVGEDRSPILLGTDVDYVTNEQCQSDWDNKDYGIDPEILPFSPDEMMCAAGDSTGTCFGARRACTMMTDTGIFSTISAVVSILLISSSVITYYTIRDHGVNCRVGRAVTSIGFDRLTFEQWRCLHVGTQVAFVAVIVFLFPVEMISFCNGTYEDFMVYANLVDHLLVLPLLGLGILSGVAMTTKRYFQDKQQYPLHPDIEVAMQVFNAFGAFWALFDAVLRRHLTGGSNSALILACRFFVNVVSIGFCFFLWRLMYNMRKSLNSKDV